MNNKINPQKMNATRALRDYLKHETTVDRPNAEANTFCMCLGFLCQTSFDLRQAAVVLDQLETDIDMERGKVINSWRFRVRMLLIRPGKYGWNTFVRSIFTRDE